MPYQFGQPASYTFGNIGAPSPIIQALLPPRTTTAGFPSSGTISAPKRSIAQRLAGAISDNLQPIVGQRMAGNIGGLVDYSPVLPISQGFQGGQDLRNGNLKSGLGNVALAAFGAVPETNYLEDLAKYAPKLFRETNLDQAQYFIPKSNSYTDLRHELYFADTPDLALGQGNNRGVLMEFNSNGLKGQINTSKPGWQPQWEGGNAEYVAKYNPQNSYQNNMTAFTLQPDALRGAGIVHRERLGRTVRQLQASGWTKTVNPDGSIRFEAPQ